MQRALTIGLVAVLGIGFAWAQQSRPSELTGAPKERVERGQYLVHHVAMCVECHTPRTEDGALIQSKLLRGAPMPVGSPYHAQKWAYRAPALAGLPGWQHSDFVRFLETGEDPRGYRPSPPMPSFRFNHEDAEAVAAYLMSLR